MNYRGLAKGKTIELEQVLPFPDGQSVLVSVEPWDESFPLGSPQAILRAMREVPHLCGNEVDQLEAAIERARLPVQAGLNLNEGI